MEVNSRAKGKIGGASSSNPSRVGVGRVTDPPENNGEESDFEPPGPKLNSSFSVNKLVSLIAKLSDEKLDLLGEIGFSCLVELKKQDRFNRQLAFWLLRNMDPSSGTIITSSGSRLRLNHYDVHIVLGLPYVGDEVSASSSCSHKDIDRVRRILMIGCAREATLEYLEHILLREYSGKMNPNERNAFKVAAVLFFDAYFLSPRGYPAKVNQNIFGHLVSPHVLCNKNWSAYVFEGLKNSSLRVKQGFSNKNRTFVLDGCLFALQVMYLDNLESGAHKTLHDMIPRISDFNYETTKNIINEDRRNITEPNTEMFGKCKLRHRGEVVYSRSRRVNTKSTDFFQQKIEELKTEINDYKSVFISKVDHSIAKFEDSVLSYLLRERTAVTTRTCEQREEDAVDSVRLVIDSSPTPCCRIKRVVHHSVQRRNPFVFDSSGSTISPMNMEDDHHSTVFFDRDPVSGSPSVRENPETSLMDEDVAEDTEPLQNVMAGGELVEVQAAGQGDAGHRDVSVIFNEELRELVGYLNLRTVGDLPWQIPRDKKDSGDLLQLSALSLQASNMEECEDRGIDEMNYPASPFELSVAHRKSPTTELMKIMRILPYIDEDDKDRAWFIHDKPSSILIMGTDIQPQFTCICDLNVGVVDAVVRLYLQMEDLMYASVCERRWRHFIGASFSVQALKGPVSFLDDSIFGMFCGEHITYNVFECRMILLPVNNSGTWSGYCWDFQRKKIVIIDPTNMYCDCEFLEELHRDDAVKIHSALFECLQILIEGWNVSEVGWEPEYLRIPGAGGARCNSGIFTLFYLLQYDGSTLRDILTLERLPFFRVDLLYKLLSMVGNLGQPPSLLESALGIL